MRFIFNLHSIKTNTTAVNTVNWATNRSSYCYTDCLS